MRFPRNVRIFRGQLDLVPLANLFFLLLIFVLLCSVIYTPGISFELDEVPAAGDVRSLTITRSGDVVFEGRTNRLEDLHHLRGEFRKLNSGAVVMLRMEPGAPRELALRVRQQARGLSGVRVEIPSTGIELPEADGLAGTPNRTVAVAVNLAGQFFLENRIVTEAELRERLKEIAAASPEPVTLVVRGDRSASSEVMVKLGQIAKEARIRVMHVVAQPSSL